MKWRILHLTIFTFTHILSILLKLNSISDALRSYLTQLVIAIFSSSHPSANSTSSPSSRLLTSFFSSQRLNLLSPRSIHVAKFEYKGIDMNTLARFFYFQQSKYYRKASESILSTLTFPLLSRYHSVRIHPEWMVDRSFNHAAHPGDKTSGRATYR